MSTVEKVAKLIPLLSSDKDGEVLATVAAIGRTLRAAGLDWHDLARAACANIVIVRHNAEGSARGSQAPAAYPKPRGPKALNPTWSRLSRAGRIAWLALLLEDEEHPELARMLDLLERGSAADVGRFNAKMFNGLVRRAWEAGKRPASDGDRRAA